MSNISIIIPVYNIEQYLGECIDSVISQLNLNDEIILINDGSTDNSGKICDAYASGNKLIKVIHQSNSGPSIARNRGLDAARNKYIMLVDGDDLLAQGVIQPMLTLIEQNKADSIRGKMTCFKKYFSYSNDPEHLSKHRLYHSSNNDFYNLVKSLDTPESACAVIYKKSFLDDHCLRFSDSILVGEDIPFGYKTILFSNKLLLIDAITYGYRVRFNSTTHSLLSQSKLNTTYLIFTEIAKVKKKLKGNYKYTELGWIMTNWFIVFMQKARNKREYFNLCQKSVTGLLSEPQTKNILKNPLRWYLIPASIGIRRNSFIMCFLSGCIWQILKNINDFRKSFQSR